MLEQGAPIRRAARRWDPKDIPPHAADPLPVDSKVQQQRCAAARQAGRPSACAGRRKRQRAMLGEQSAAVAREIHVARTKVDVNGGGKCVAEGDGSGLVYKPAVARDLAGGDD